MNPPIKYFGGKNGMASSIISHFPAEQDYKIYIEPFGGSYGIGLHMDYIPPIEIYNDLDKNVYSLYKVLSNNDMFNRFKERCDLAMYSQDLREEYRLSLRNKDLDMEDRAFYYFYVNRTSHNGIGGLSVNLTVRRNMSKSVSDMLSCIDRLPELHQRLSRVMVLNQDAMKLIEKHINSTDVFMYLDPPYHVETRTAARYPVDMTANQHEEFVDLCCDAKAKMLISGYYHPVYDKLLEHGFTRHDFQVKTISGDFQKKTKTETIWKNYGKSNEIL